MRALSIALAVAAGAVALAFGLQFFGNAQPRIVGQTGTQPAQFVGFLRAGGRICQAGEPLTTQARKMQLTIGTYHKPGPLVTAEVVKGGRVVGRGALAAGWHEGVVQMPLRVHANGTGTVCIRSAAKIAIGGEPGAQPMAKPGMGRLSFVYFSTPRALSGIAGAIARHYGYAQASWLGPWTMWVIAVLLVAALAAVGITLRAAALGGDGVARGAALTAVLIGGVWALLTPPFHVVDEVSHVAYVQYLAETGKLPHEAPGQPYSTEEQRLLNSMRFYTVIGRADFRPPNTPAAEAVVRAVERDHDRRDNGEDADTASANPPLFYLLEAPVYLAAPGSLLDKLLPMRLLSVLLGALTVLLVTLFARELLPRSPWTWAAAGLAVALQPMFGFIVGGVNADSLMYACSAGTLLVCAHILRRGLTLRRAVVLGAVVAAGVLTKPLFLALVPAAALAVLVAVLRRGGAPLRRRALIAAAAAAVVLVPLVLYQAVGASAFDHPYFAKTAAASPGAPPSRADTASRAKEISFVAQLFLPRLPFLTDMLPGTPLRNIWLNNFLGYFGWLDYRLPGWIYTWGLWIALAVGLAALISLVVHRRAVRARWLELAVYAVAMVGVALVVGSQDFIARENNTSVFEQGRYLFPLLALYGGLVAVAMRLAGSRWGVVAATGFATLAAIHTVTALLATVVRYYS